MEGRGRPLEKRGLIIISNRVPEHPRFTGLTHVRTPPRGHVREGFRVLRIETWGWNFNWNVELTGLNLRKKIWNAIRRLHGNILLRKILDFGDDAERGEKFCFENCTREEKGSFDRTSLTVEFSIILYRNISLEGDKTMKQL